MIFSVFQKNRVLGYSWSTLLWHRCYYPHLSRDSLSPVCGIFSCTFISRPGQSQGLLYKQPCHSLINSFIHSLSHPFPPTALPRRHAQMGRDRASSYKIDYVIVITTFLNPKGHQNPINGSKVTAILLKGWISPIGGASALEGL